MSSNAHVLPPHDHLAEAMQDVTLHLAIIKEFGHVLGGDALILDFGCGDGHMVRAYRASGLQAFGADVHIGTPDEWLRPICEANGTYRLPFADNTFDFLYSNSVLEHVEDLESALAEMHRVLKPNGASLHFFPPRAKPIEPHVLVPFGGVLQSRPWLLLWAYAGIRHTFQGGLSAPNTALRNYHYLHHKAFYRSKRQMEEQFCRYFRNVMFANGQMIRHSYGRAKALAPLADRLPFVAASYGCFHQRCVYFRK